MALPSLAGTKKLVTDPAPSPASSLGLLYLQEIVKHLPPPSQPTASPTEHVKALLEKQQPHAADAQLPVLEAKHAATKNALDAMLAADADSPAVAVLKQELSQREAELTRARAKLPLALARVSSASR